MQTPPVMPPTPGAAPPPAWSKKLAARHALFALVVVISAGFGAFALLKQPESDGRLFGEGLGRLSVFTAGVAFLASWLHQTGRRRVAVGVVAAFSTLVVGLFIALAVGERHRIADTISDAERAPLQVVEQYHEQRLMHPAFGFSLRHPGPGFREAPEVVAAMGMQRDPSTQWYGFMEPATGATLLISVMKGMGGSEAKLTQHLDGLLAGIEHSLAGKATARVLTRGVLWDESRHVGTLSLAVGDLTHVEVAAYSVDRPGQAPFIVNLMIMAPDAKRFAALLDSFRS